MDGHDVVRPEERVDLADAYFARFLGVVGRVDDDERVAVIVVELRELNVMTAILDRQLVKAVAGSQLIQLAAHRLVEIKP